MHYTGHFVGTRIAAQTLGIFLAGVLTPFLLQRIDWNQPGRTAGLTLLTLLPFLISFRCLRFLKKQETQHASPTPEMSFIFGLSISFPLAIAVAALIVLNT